MFTIQILFQENSSMAMEKYQSIEYWVMKWKKYKEENNNLIH